MERFFNTPEGRQTLLMERVAAGEPLVLAQLAAEFDVSVDTIRRDILALEAAGTVQRVRGGALPVAKPAAPVRERLATENTLAEKLAAAALPLVEDGMVLMLDGGTSVLQLARALPRLPAALVVTSSPAVAIETLGRGTETVLLGGRLSQFGEIAVGQVALRMTADIAADLCFLGACGLAAGYGLGADDPDEAAVKNAMAQASGRVAVLTGAAKLGRRGRHRVLRCAEIDLLVTDAPAQQTVAFSDAGLEIRHV